MAQSLKVVTAFGPFVVDQTISDPGQVAAILAAGYGPDVVDGSAAGPAPPDTLIVVFGVPSPALGGAYKWAIDLTSTPNTVYKWSGAVWAVVFQAGAGAPVTAPGAVAAAPTSSAVTASSISLAWLAPITGGLPSDYFVQYKRSIDPTWITVDEASTQLAATVTGLTAATSYDLRVQASNSAGQGATSPVLTVSTAAAPPAQPAGIAADANDATITTLL